jgi:hypothetical protein
MISPPDAVARDRDCFELLWTRPLTSGAAGLCLARERGWVLAWDQSHWLYLLDPDGKSQAQRQLAGLTVACAADDTSAYAAAGKKGEVWWLAPDLMPRWERRLTQTVLAVALDPFGQYLAAADAQGQVHLFDHTGRRVCCLEVPRPLCHLAFVPAAPFLVGSADYGLVVAFNLKGEIHWREGLVANVGSLAVDGDGRQLLLACFSEGMHRYGIAADRAVQQAGAKVPAPLPPLQKLARLTLPDACHRVAQTFDGHRLLAAGLHHRIFLLDRAGKVLGSYMVEKAIAAIALGALGKDAFVALEGGPLLKLAL